MKRGELKKQIEFCLKNFPETRNSDIELTIRIWETYYPQRIHTSKTGVEVIKVRDLFDLPREDNVKRIRAKFNELGKYLPTSEKVAKQRGIEEGEWRKEMMNFVIEEKERIEKKQLCEHGLPLMVICPDCKK
jgi:hypothetical protein